MRVRTHALLTRSPSVQESWSAHLSVAKAQAFDFYIHNFNALYNMFSVALNEALEFRRTGRAAQAQRAIFVIPALCNRLVMPLEDLFHTLGEHARHFGTIPDVASLDPANFRGPQEQSEARISGLLSRVLFTQRLQFLHKIATLEQMAWNLRVRFQEIATDLGSGASLEPGFDWQAAHDAHFDLNTCLREGIVLLKSFLVVVSDDQLVDFQRTVSACLANSQENSGALPLPRRRRMVPIEGE